jgi:hypothetical protein
MIYCKKDLCTNARRMALIGLVWLQFFDTNRFIVMSKMQKGVHGWFLSETCSGKPLCKRGNSDGRGGI